MNLYLLRNANEPEITGNIYPQISKHKEWCWENYEFLSTLRPDRLPETNFSLDYLLLDPKAKLTDFISDGVLQIGFIIENKVKDIFGSMMLPHHRFFPAKISYRDKIFDTYNWFFPVSQVQKKINYPSSDFYVTNRFVESMIVNEQIKIKSADEIKEYEKQNPTYRVRPKKVELFEKINLDIFQVGVFSFDWIITERLKEKLEAHKINGYTTRPISWLIN